MQNELEKFIRDNRGNFDNQSPAPQVLGRILWQMQQKGEVKPKGVLISFLVLRLTAACALLLAIGIAYWTLRRQPEIVPITRVKQTPQPGKSGAKDAVSGNKPEKISGTLPPGHKNIDAIDQDLAMRKHLLAAALKEHLSQRKKKLAMFAGLNNMYSPASRISAASEADQFKSAEQDVVDALATTLDSDPNTNVRLAALDGLAQFYQDKHVRKKLIASLKKQQDPLVEIALINLLTRMKESAILRQLKQMVEDDNTLKAVKDCAYSSMFSLRSS